MVLRPAAPILFWLIGTSIPAQDPVTVGALGHASSVSLPLSKAIVFERAIEAWNTIIAIEPGATLVITDPDTGILEGTARIRFRSHVLSGREQTMGSIHYRIRIQAMHGECRIAFSAFKHTGNPGAARGAIDLGLLTASGPPAQRLPGLSRPIATRIMDEARKAALERAVHITRLFEASLRSGTTR
ncbi:MAG: hypothetical protein H6595_03725 [Flavobacteriales bacterium]|nr:hypothetical protein [Flavobacteriales bacterium]MCB9166569.1 hypothetical protein [Flavobacteriales bacterium]MCB9194549.1 hypothetical protein [Flavobacteriales bacterium]